MYVKAHYNRHFIIMEEEDKGFAVNGKSSGYMKIEVNDDRINIQVYIQNINSNLQDKVLKGYLLSSYIKDVVYIGTLQVKENKANNTYKFNKNSDLVKNVDITKFDTALIICEDTESKITAFKIPLVGFKNGPWEYRNVLRNFIMSTNTLNTKDNEKPIKKIKENTKKEIKQDKAIKEQETKKEEEVDEKAESKKIEQVNEKPETEEVKEDNKEVSLKNIKQNNKKVNFTKYLNEIQPFDKNIWSCKWYFMKDYKSLLTNKYITYNNICLLYNPQFISAFYKYRHYIYGIQKDKNNNVSYIYLGIPSKFGTEPNPIVNIQAYSYWYPAKGQKFNVGSLGYWITKINVKENKFETLNV